MKPTFEVCTTDVLDSMKLPTSAHVLTVDWRSKFKQSYVLAASKMNPTFPTHAHEVGALTFEVTDNFGSNDVLPCGAYGPWSQTRNNAARYTLDGVVPQRPCLRSLRHAPSSMALTTPIVSRYWRPPPLRPPRWPSG